MPIIGDSVSIRFVFEYLVDYNSQGLIRCFCVRANRKLGCLDRVWIDIQLFLCPID